MDAKHHGTDRGWRSSVLAIVGVCFVVLSGIGALLIVGSPKTARQRKLDEARVHDLAELRWQINKFYQDNDLLPISLDQLNYGGDSLTDPDSGEPYGYRVVNSRTYELSARFALEFKGESWRREWSHPAGPHSFSIAVPNTD